MGRFRLMRGSMKAWGTVGVLPVGNSARGSVPEYALYYLNLHTSVRTELSMYLIIPHMMSIGSTSEVGHPRPSILTTAVRVHPR